MIKDNFKYCPDKAIKAQHDYCEKNDVPNFAPAFDGTCFHCMKNIYEPNMASDGSVTGITVSKAGTEHITYCPHCHYSFID